MIKFTPLQKQLWQSKKNQKTDTNEETVSQNTCAPDEAAGGEVLSSSEHMPEAQHAPEPSDSNKGRKSVHDRMRVPVSYDDLFEEVRYRNKLILPKDRLTRPKTFHASVLSSGEFFWSTHATSSWFVSPDERKLLLSSDV